MKRIMIEWVDNLEDQKALRGIVYVNSQDVVLLHDGSKWRIIVEGQGSNMTIRQDPMPGESRLPIEHANYSQEVEKLAKTYYYGFYKIPEVFAWVE